MSASDKSVGDVESNITNISGDTDSVSEQTAVNVFTSSDDIDTLNSVYTAGQSADPINSDALSESDAVNESVEPRPTRISAKQRREELDHFKSEYLVPHKFEKKHNVAIEDDQWELLDLVVRRVGDRKANATSYLNAIIAAHLREALPEVKEWVTL